MKKFFSYTFGAIIFFLLASPAFANNLVISNVTLEDRNPTSNTMVVQFNISWDHSWRKNDGRHDAVWVFVKILQNATNPYIHGILKTSGTNPVDTSSGTNSDLKIVIPTDKIGAFLERTATGNGTFESQKVRLTVDYGSSGIADTDTVQVQVHGIEMVYIPEGPFYVGEANNTYSAETQSGAQGSLDIFASSFNSAGTFQWAKHLGGSASDQGNAIAVENNNAFLIGGQITGNADLNGDGDTTDSAETGGGIYGGFDGFVSVFNSAGVFQWAKRLGGTGDDSINALAVDSATNIIVGGQVAGNGDLNGDGDTADSNETGNTGVYGSTDAFFSVFNSAGTFQWSKRLGGSAGIDAINSIAVDADNRIIVSGTVWLNADLNGDGDTADSYETGLGTYDAFVSVFNSAGTFQWAKRLGGTDFENAPHVAVDHNNNIVVTGGIVGNVDLNGDGDTADSAETGGGIYGSYDGFISIFNSAGTFQWAKRLGGTSIDYISAVGVDSSNDIFVTGLSIGNADLNGDGDTADANETASGIFGIRDIFISSFNSSGTFLWSKRLGGTLSDEGYGLAVDHNNIVYVTGKVNGAGDLNGDGDTADSNENTGGIYAGEDPFISVFNSSGTFQWSKRLGGGSNEQGNALAINSNNDLLVTGLVTGNADLDGDAAITSTYALYSPGSLNSAAQITTTGSSIATYSNTNDDIDTTPTTVTGLAGITGNSSWPNGYGAFYMMKYEITQEQYKNFLNDLSRVQQGNRVGATVSGNTIANYYVMSNGTSVSYRNGIRAPASGNGTSPTAVVFGNDLNGNGTFNETDDGQSVAMNWINWPDLCAYADWAGLRPMTELEFEKAAHGPNSPTYGEYAWGSTTTPVTSISNSGRSNEAAANSGNGLAAFGGSSNGYLTGPLRTGFTATATTNRLAAGAGYYGNMNLSDNVTERAVTLGNTTGRAFTGTHGDGNLVNSGAGFDGNATNNDWPGINGTTNKGVTSGTGGGWRGGNWSDLNVSTTNSSQPAFIADRNNATGGTTTRDNKGGGRLVRTAP